MSTDTRTIYVVNWTVTEAEGLGGFEWRTDRAEAEAVAVELRTDDPTVELHTTTVPADLDGWQVSELLDEEGWSDGGDPLAAYRPGARLIDTRTGDAATVVAGPATAPGDDGYGIVVAYDDDPSSSVSTGSDHFCPA